MATWRIWPSTSGDVVAADTTANSLSNEFTVTAAGCSITGYWWWCPATGSTTAKTFSLWSCTTGTTGTRITAANATSGTQTAGAWNFTACTPTALTANQHYRVIMTFAGGANYYAATANYWATGPGSADIVNGPLTAFTQANALGNIQSGFIAGSTVAYTTGQFNNSNYWIDVQVDDGAAAAPVVSPARPGPAWLRRFHHRQAVQFVPPPPQTIQAAATLTGAGRLTAGTAAFPAIPGVARPGLFTPGNPGSSTMVTTPPALPVAAARPAQPGPAWLRRFRHRQQQPLAAAAAVIDSTGASLAGAGSLTAAGTQGTGAALAGAGALSASAVQAAGASLPGAASLSAAAAQAAGAFLAGTGALSSPAVQGAGAALAGTGALTAAGTASGAAVANITGAGSLTAGAVQAAGASLAGAGVLPAKAVQVAGASLAGAGTLAALATEAAGAALAAAGSLTAAGSVAGGTAQGAAVLAGAGVLTAKAAQGAGASLAGSGTLAAPATQRSGAVLAAAGTITATGLVPPPFTTGLLTASSAPGSALTASASASALTASTQATGGPS